MAWAGTGAVWTMAGGVLKGMPIEHGTGGAMPVNREGGLRFAQISDSHIGFDKPANADVTATLRAAISKIKAAPEPPSFVLHTGDLTHLSKPSEFDTVQQVLSELSVPVFSVPGEHDVLGDDGQSYLRRFGKDTQGAGWHSFDQGGVHFRLLSSRTSRSGPCIPSGAGGPTIALARSRTSNASGRCRC